MKKALCLLYVIIMLPLLCGCDSFFLNQREVEHLLVIQTMGIDRDGEEVSLSLASAADRTSGPVRLSGRGESVTTAIDRIRRHSYENDLFSAHVSHIVIGEAAAKDGIDGIIAYICRSPDIRIDVPMYVVKGGTAAELVLNSGDGSVGASEILNGIQTSLRDHDAFRSITAAEAARSLARHGSTLICALEYADGSKGGEDGGKTASICGYAVIRNGALCAFLDREESIAAGLLMNEDGISDIVVKDHSGKPVTLEIDRGSAEIRAVTDGGGTLTGLDVFVRVGASVTETEDDSAGTDYLTARLESAVSDSVGAVLSAEKELGADFLGLGSRIKGLSGDRFREPGSFALALPELTLRVHVSAELAHTNDIRDA